MHTNRRKSDDKNPNALNHLFEITNCRGLRSRSHDLGSNPRLKAVVSFRSEIELSPLLAGGL